MNKISLRLRITMITTLIISFIAVLLTITSIENARKSYLDPFESQTKTGVPGISFSSKGIEISDVDGNYVSLGEDGVNVKDDSGVVTSIGKNGIHIYSQVATKHFKDRSIIFMIIIVIIGGIVTYLITGFTLKPLTELNDSIKKINDKNLSERIKNENTTDEIASLTHSFNHMLDRLEKAFQNQKQFAANASHELKTPLSVIKTGIQVLNLDDTPSIDDYKETLAITEKSTDRLIKVVDDLLLLSKDESNSFHDLISTKDTLLLICKELQPLADKNCITIEPNLIDYSLNGNASLFYQAFYNLIDNGIKYNKTGGFVKVSSQIEDNFFKIKVGDSGIGIPKDALDVIFEPFYRADKSRSREVGGSGLGLSLVKSIIEKHDGSIEVQSILDLGTTFTVTLPLS